ncbi:hypothetical protein OS21_14610 [Dickeya oryzae]
MGLYTTAIMAGAALAAATVSPLADVMDWDGALAIWGGLATLAAVAWMITVSINPMPNNAPHTKAVTTLSRSRAWALMIFFWYRHCCLHAGAGLVAALLHPAWLEFGP